MNVLAVGAHAFGTLFLAGGTLARYAADGHRVTLAIVYSPPPESLAPGETALAWENEALRAASLIGATVHHLRLDASNLSAGDGAAQSQLADVIREATPRVILTHDPLDHFSEHVVTSELVFRCRSVHGRRTGATAAADPPEVIYMDTLSGLGFEPEQFVDITDVFATKREMIACCQREIEEWPNNPTLPWPDWLTVQSRYRGIQGGVGYAEAFRRPAAWGNMSPARLLP